MGDLNRKDLGQTTFQPDPGDPYSPLREDQWATQGLAGAPLVRPQTPGKLPEMPPLGTPGKQPGLPMPGLVAPPPSQAVDPLTRAQENLALGIPSPDDMMILDAAYAKDHGGAGAGGVSTTSTTQNSSTQGVTEDPTGDLMVARQRKVDLEENQRARASELGAEQEATGLAKSQAITGMSEQLLAKATADEKRRQEQTETLQKTIKDGEKLGQAYLDAAQNIDPARLYKGAGRVWAALALGLGAVGASFGHHENFAAKVISDAVSNDLEGQKLNLAAKKDAMTANQQLFQNYRQLYGDDEAAREKVLAVNLRAGAAKVDAMTAKMAGKEQRAATKNASDSLSMAANQADINSQELLSRKAYSNSSSTTTQTQSGGASSGGADSDFLGRITKAAAAAKAVSEQHEGAFGKDDPIQYREVSNAIGDAAGAAKTLQDLRESVGKGLTDKIGRAANMGEGGRKFNDLEKMAKLALTKATTGLTSTEQERKEIGEIISGGAWTVEGVNEKLDRVEAYLARMVAGKAQVLSPTQRDTLVRRMTAGGADPNIINSLLTGSQISQANTQASASGFSAGAK